MIHVSRLKRFWIHLCLLKFINFKFSLEKNWCCQLNTMNNVPVTKTFWRMTGKLPELAIHVYRKRQLLLLELSFHSPYHQRWKLFLCSQYHIWNKKANFQDENKLKHILQYRYLNKDKGKKEANKLC